MVRHGRLEFSGRMSFQPVLSQELQIVRGTNFGTAAYQQAARAIQGRIVRVGAQMKW